MTRLKRFLSLFLAVIMLAGISVPSFADDAQAVYSADNLAQAADEPLPGSDGMPVEINLGEAQSSVYLNYGAPDQIGFADLSVAAASDSIFDGCTLTVTADQNIASRIVFKKNVTVTDDGMPHTLYFCNQDSSSTGGHGRGLQVNSGKTITVASSSAGLLTVCGRSMESAESSVEYAAGNVFYVYNGSLILSGLNITECSNSAVAAHSTGTRNITVSNCCFSGNTAKTGADINLSDGTALTLDGSSIIEDISTSLSSPIAVEGSFEGCSITVNVTDTSVLKIDNQVYSGSESSVKSASKFISIPGMNGDYKVTSSGVIALRTPFSVDSTPYTTFEEAYEAVKSNGTILLTDDAVISSSYKLTKNLTIKDDGDSHTLYICNTDSSDNYGRGLQVSSNKTVSITATKKGNITIVGHDITSSNYNYAALLYAYRGTLTLNNIIVTEARCTNYGAIMTYNGIYTTSSNVDTLYTGTLNLNNCTVTGNTTSYRKGGAAIYNQGVLNLNDGTVIDGNFSTSSVSGGIYNDEYTDTGDAGTSEYLVGVTTVNGNVTVTGNRKNCSKQEGSGISGDGLDSDIYATVPQSISFKALSGSVGVDYCGDGDVFASCDDDFTALAAIRNNNDSTMTNSKSGTSLSWSVFCEIVPGSALISGSAYTLPNASVTIPSGAGGVLSIAVDCGSFTFDWSGLEPAAGTKTVDDKWQLADYSAESCASSYKGVSIVGEWTAEKAQSFLRSVIFSTEKLGMTQSVTVGILPAAPVSGIYYSGSTFSFLNSDVSHSSAVLAAQTCGGHLASISDKGVNSAVSSIIEPGRNAFLSGQLLSDNWYWVGGRLDGVRISASSSSSQGYNNTYTAWAQAQPDSGSYMTISSDGAWVSTVSSADGYVLELEDSNAARFDVTVDTSSVKLSLSSLSLSVDDDISVNYYFRVPQSLLNSDNARVDITVGSNDPISFYFKDFATSGNLSSVDSAYKVTVPFKPKELDADVKLDFYNASGKYINSIGGPGEGKTQYNPVWYAENVILKKDSGDCYNASFSAELIALVSSLVEYGKAAKAQFVPGSEYAAPDGITAPSDIASAVFTKNTDTAYELSLISNSRTTIRIRPVITGAFSAVVDGETVSSENGYIDIDVSAGHLSRIYTVILTGGVSDQLRMNAAAVIKAILSDAEAGESIINTADRLYKLSVCADAFFGVYTPAASTLESVLSTAYAYLAKTRSIQYDQKKFNSYYFSGYSNQRRQNNASPELASTQNSIYLDCSSFVWNVYSQVFGEAAVRSCFKLSFSDFRTVNLISCRTNAFVASFDPADEGTYAALMSTLQPGDIIVKYDNSAAHGHVVLWTGAGYIHCTGASYDYDSGTDKIEKNGAVYFVPASSLNSSWYSGFDKLVVFRPLNELSSVSNYGTARRQLGSLSVEKTAFCGSKALLNGRSVSAGSEITYKITLSNPILSGQMTTSREVTVSDTLPSGVSLVSGSVSNGGTVSENCISWSVTVAPGESVVLEYVCTVTEEIGNTIAATAAVCRSAEAGALAEELSFSNNALTVEAAKANEVSAFISKAQSSTGAEGLATLNTLLSDSGLSTLCDSDSAWLNGIFSSTESGLNYYVSLKSLAISKFVVSNFASGHRVLSYYTGGDAFLPENRVRNISADNLEAGDVIAVYDSGVYTYYIYLGGQNMAELTDGTACTVSNNADAVITSLLSKDCFAIFRMTR